MITEDLPLPMDEILDMARWASGKFARRGESCTEIPAYSDALWGALRAIRKLDATPDQDQRNPRPLLWRCMFNYIIDEGRKTAKFYEHCGASIEEKIAAEEFADEEGDGETPAEKKEFLEYIISLKEWDEESRRRWRWIEEKYIHGVSFREIGLREGMTFGQVKSRCDRLLKELRLLVERQMAI